MLTFRRKRGREREAFTLIELLVVIAIIALLIAILLPALAEAKRQGKMVAAMSNLHQFSVATNSYTADFHDRIWSFSWKKTKPGEKLPSRWTELQTADSDTRAAVCQAVDILRRRAERDNFPDIDRWIPHVSYSHLVLQDYLAQRLPERMVADPADKHRLEWQQDPREKFDEGHWLPFQEDPRSEEGHKRWPYSSSWQIVPASYDRSPAGLRVYQDPRNESSYFSYENSSLGGGKLADVSHGSQKVLLMDSEERHFNRVNKHYGDPTHRARVLVTLFDGHARAIVTDDANQGWLPNQPHWPSPTWALYTPKLWEAPLVGGAASDHVRGWYRWTRGGLKGIDFGRPEVFTGQPKVSGKGRYYSPEDF